MPGTAPSPHAPPPRVGLSAGMPDIERLTRKLEAQRSSLSDLCQLYRASSVLPRLEEALRCHEVGPPGRNLCSPCKHLCLLPAPVFTLQAPVIITCTCVHLASTCLCSSLPRCPTVLCPAPGVVLCVATPGLAVAPAPPAVSPHRCRVLLLSCLCRGLRPPYRSTTMNRT
jgi:hypothetical protein